MPTCSSLELWSAVMLIIQVYFGNMIHGQDVCVSTFNRNHRFVFVRPVIKMRPQSDQQQLSKTSHRWSGFCNAVTRLISCAFCFAFGILYASIATALWENVKRQMWLLYQLLYIPNGWKQQIWHALRLKPDIPGLRLKELVYVLLCR